MAGDINSLNLLVHGYCCMKQFYFKAEVRNWVNQVSFHEIGNDISIMRLEPNDS